MLLELNNVSLSLKRDGKYVKILDEISLQVNKGETVGIVGESGCGKSMTALSVMRLLPEKAKLEGAIRLEKDEITSYSKKENGKNQRR
ncbi:ATP-binding cassette domain-containing protein [Mesobacillus sp. LC4]